MAKSFPRSGGRDTRASDATSARIESILRERLQQDVTLIGAHRVGTDDRGFPIYKLTYQAALGGMSLDPKIHTRTYSYTQGKLIDPAVKGSALPPDPVGDPRITGDTSADDLQHRKDLWLSHVARNPNLTDAHRADLTRIIQDYDGGLLQLNNLVKRYIESATNAPPPDLGGGFEPEISLGGGGGGGGGRGFTGPTYRAPDRRVVEDYVKGTMISLLGAIDETLLGQAVSVYMNDHRRNFDNPQQEIDPTMSVVEHIRNTEDYQQIHSQRPDSEDERQWVGKRLRAAEQGGLDVDEREGFARVQAAVGGRESDVVRAAAVQQTASSGSTRGTVLEDKVKQAASAIFQGVR